MAVPFLPVVPVNVTVDEDGAAVVMLGNIEAVLVSAITEEMVL